jgi:hypothetical protein
MRTSPIKFVVLAVTCRSCGERIGVELPEGLTPDEQIAECERQAEKHTCPPEVA